MLEPHISKKGASRLWKAGAIGLAFAIAAWGATKFFSGGKPQNTKAPAGISTPLQTPKTPPPVFPPIDRKKEQRIAKQEVEAAYSWAKEHNLLPLYEYAAARTGVDVIDLLTVSCFESGAGRHKKPPVNRDGTRSSSATGLFQYLDDVIIECAARLGKLYLNDIARFDKFAANKLRYVLDNKYLYLNKNGKVVVDENKYKDDRKREADRLLASWHIKKGKKIPPKLQARLKALSVPLRNIIASLSESNITSLLFAGTELAADKKALLAGLKPDHFTYSLIEKHGNSFIYRVRNNFGFTGTKKMIFAEPVTPMTQLGKSPNTLEINGWPSYVTAGRILEVMAVKYDCTRCEFETRLADNKHPNNEAQSVRDVLAAVQPVEPKEYPPQTARAKNNAKKLARKEKTPKSSVRANFKTAKKDAVSAKRIKNETAFKANANPPKFPKKHNKGSQLAKR
ncbi:MAG: hypothetical protein PHY92_05230 [Alphaproteobacteria bacterium]|nr:hypothetical protein [Alphaproteobacteria bacterium]